MHAVILRDSHRVLLRAYTVPIEVNGLLTGETFLNVGDQFTLGSYHFELTDAPDTLMHQSPVSRVVEAPQSNSAWSEMPLRVAATPLSFTDQDTVEVQLPSSGPSDLAEFANNTEFANQRKRPEASDYGLHNQSAAEKKPTRGRLSFVSGGTYVSEALQAFSTTSPTHRDDATTRSSFRADADHLRNEVDAWRKREQRWKEQDLQTRAELEDAVSRFHESQDRAVQAGQAVAEMRARMEQLGEELAELKNDSTEYRHQAAQRQERLREAADAASAARLESLRQRDEANREYDQVDRDREQLRRERDQLLSTKDHAIAQRDQAIAERDLARGDRDRLAFVSEEFGQHRNSARSAQAEMTERIRKLSTELELAAEQLRAARTELAAAYARVQSLSIESAQVRKQLQNRDQAQAQQTQAQEALIESLRTEINKLEADCAAARSQAASAATDRNLVRSLQSALASTETSRAADRKSWEQEATSLQENIGQLSLELAAVTGRMTQSELDHDETKSELNNVHGRLTTARREVTMRPTSEQWDELQSQLAETEQQLDETEKQLGLIRRDYDDLLGRQSTGTPAVAVAIELASVEQPAASSINANAALPAFAPLSEIVVAAEPVQESIDEIDNTASNDHGWPTYQAHSDYALPIRTEPPATVEDDGSDQSSPSEPWPCNEAEIADRLQSYTTHDESHRHGHLNGMTPLDVSPSEPVASVLSIVEPIHSIPQPTTEADVAKDSSELGSLAKRLIAQLSEASSAESSDDSSTAGGQSLTASSIWERVSEQSTTGELANDNDYDTPSVWNFSSQFRAADELNDDDNEQADANEDEEIDEEVDQTFMLPTDSREHNFGIVGKRAELENEASDESFSEQLPRPTRVFDFHAGSEATQPAAEVSRFEPQSAVITHEETAAAVPNGEPDDDSIEAYMNRLLKRVQGQSGGASESASAKPTAITAAQPAADKVSTSAIPIAKPTETPAPPKPIEVVDPNTPLVPRRQAPEHADNMAAMREIANATADNAISQSVRGQAQQLKSRAIMDLFQAGVVLLCAGAFYFCGLKVISLRYVWFTAAGLATALAVFFFMDMLKKLSSAKASYDRANSQASSSFTEDNGA